MTTSMSGPISLSPLWSNGEVRELRLPKTPHAGVVSGYFDDPARLATAATAWDGKADGVYLTINPVDPALLARAANRVVQHARATTADHDVLRRHWLPIDLDPVRPSGISSSDTEHAAALSLAHQVRDWLFGLGLPRESMILADSGNGAHVLVRVDLANTPETATLCQRVLEATALQWANDIVHVDQTTFNASRIMKVYGTIAGKGENLPERPHRRSALLEVPDIIYVAPVEALAHVAARAPSAQAPQHSNGNGLGFDVDAFVAQHLAEIADPPKPWQNGRLWRLRECLFDATHTGGSAALIQMASGALVYKCQHDSCAGRSWSDVRQKLAPAAVSNHPMNGHQNGNGNSRTRTMSAEKADQGTRPKLACIDSMADVERKEIDWLWRPYIPVGKLTMLEGDPGVGKSWLTLAIASAVSRGAPLPRDDQSARGPRRVLLVGAEDDLEDTVKPRLEATGADDRLIRPVIGMLNGGDEISALTLSSDGITALEDHIAEYRPALVIIDPLIEYLESIDTNKAAEVRHAVRPLRDVAKRQGVAVLCIRHLNKSVGLLAKQRGQGSMDFVAIVRSGLVVGTDPGDKDRVIMAPYKNNIARMGDAVAFRLPCARTAGAFAWELEDSVDANTLLATPEAGEDRKAISEAKSFLVEVLRSGPCPAREVIREARECDVSERTLRRARQELNVQVRREGTAGFRGAGHFTWTLSELPENVLMANPTIHSVGHQKDSGISGGTTPETGGVNLFGGQVMDGHQKDFSAAFDADAEGEDDDEPPF